MACSLEEEYNLCACILAIVWILSWVCYYRDFHIDCPWKFNLFHLLHTCNCTYWAFWWHCMTSASTEHSKLVISLKFLHCLRHRLDKGKVLSFVPRPFLVFSTYMHTQKKKLGRPGLWTLFGTWFGITTTFAHTYFKRICVVYDGTMVTAACAYCGLWKIFHQSRCLTLCSLILYNVCTHRGHTVQLIIDNVSYRYKHGLAAPVAK